ncbi:MAG: hypothetical protein LQ350_007886 [Teloschistes chrysophthalmus]|nr:MAG: hypothetical protein LQ350_007886 [Niorma chrysophthalma]
MDRQDIGEQHLHIRRAASFVRERRTSMQRDEELQQRMREAQITERDEFSEMVDRIPFQPTPPHLRDEITGVTIADLDTLPRLQALRLPPTPPHSTFDTLSPPPPPSAVSLSPLLSTALSTQISRQRSHIADLEDQLRVTRDENTSLRAENNRLEDQQVQAIDNGSSEEEIRALDERLEHYRRLLRQARENERALEQLLNVARDEAEMLRRTSRQMEGEKADLEDSLAPGARRREDAFALREQPFRRFSAADVNYVQTSRRAEPQFWPPPPPPPLLSLPFHRPPPSPPHPPPPPRPPNRGDVAERNSRPSSRRSIKEPRGAYISVPRGQRHAGSTLSILFGL